MLNANVRLSGRWRWSVAGVLVVAVTAVGAALAIARNTDGASRPSLHTVPARFLEGIELNLSVPDLDAPIVSEEKAESAARREYPSGRALEAVLARCIGPQLDQTCWLVSLQPAGMESSAGSPSHPSMPRDFRYLLVVIDAHTGAFVTSFSGT